MEQHRSSGWYFLGGTPLTAGVGLGVGWFIAVESHATVGRPRLWSAPSYIASGLVVVGMFLIFAVMIEWWPFGQRTKEEAPVVTGMSPPIAVAESDQLRITIDKEEWHPFNYEELILGVRITVVNKSDQEHVLTGVGIQGVEPWRLSMDEIDAERERHRYKKSRPEFHGTSPPGETTVGWVAFDLRLHEGRPGYTVSVSDGVGNEYRLPVAARAPESFGAEL
jgi:hypothetical protein